MTQEKTLTLTGKPVDPAKLALLEQYHLEPVKQLDQVQQLLIHLLAIELAIPGIYISAIATLGKQAQEPLWIGAAYALWLLASIFTLIGLFPKKWQVYAESINASSDQHGNQISVTAFYTKATAYKRGWLFVSLVCFFAATTAAAIATLI